MTQRLVAAPHCRIMDSPASGAIIVVAMAGLA